MTTDADIMNLCDAMCAAIAKLPPLHECRIYWDPNLGWCAVHEFNGLGVA